MRYFLPPVFIASSTSGRAVRFYHTDFTCQNLPVTPLPISFGQADRRGLHQCKICAGTDARGQSSNNDPRRYDSLIEQIQATDSDLPTPTT